MSAITAKASRKMKKYAVLTREPRCFLGSFDFSWEQRKVQGVADRFDNLRIPVAANLRVHGTTPYYGANGIQDYVEGFTHDGEFVLVAEDGANDLKNYPVKCVNGRIWVNNHAHVLQGKAGIADNSFLAFAISQSDIESLLVGGGRAKLNAETLMSIEFRLPCLQEQYRIGEYLTQLNHLITLHQRECISFTGRADRLILTANKKRTTSSWEQRKLGDVVQITMGQSPDGSTYSDEPSDYILVQGNADLQNGWVCPRIWTTQITKKADAGDLIMSVRAPAGAMGKTAYNAVIGRGVAAIKGNEFIYQLLVKMDADGFWKTLSCGSTFESLNSDNIKNAEVKIPTTAEQIKIGGYFQQLDNLITLHQRKFEKLTNVKKSMLEKMFPQNGSSYPEIRFKGFTDPWEQRKFDEAFIERRDKTEKENEDILLSCAINGMFLNSELFGHFRGTTTIGYLRVKKNDLILSAQNLHLGNANVNLRFEHGIISPAYKVYDLNNCNPEFVQSWVKRDDTKNFFLAATTEGASQCRKNIEWETLGKQTISMPSLDEQNRVGSFFKQLDNLITLHQRELEKLQNIKKSMLEKMFV
jgi:type I restriction enzyme S subunit